MNFIHQVHILKESCNYIGQLDFSIYQVKRIVYQHGLPCTREYSNIIVENSGTLGLEYKLANRIFLFSGIGIQSYKGFFLRSKDFHLVLMPELNTILSEHIRERPVFLLLPFHC